MAFNRSPFSWNETGPIRFEGCYGSILYSKDDVSQTTRSNDALFRDRYRARYFWFYLDLKDIKVKEANWFLHKFVLPRIPERARPAITITRVFKKWLRTSINEIEQGAFKRYNLHPWIQISIDPEKITFEDLYVLLSTVRLAMEIPDVVVKFKGLVDKYPKTSWDVLYYLACLRYISPGWMGHPILGSYMEDMGEHGELKEGSLVRALNYDFGKLWEIQPIISKGPYLNFVGKHNVECHFWNNGRKYSSYSWRQNEYSNIEANREKYVAPLIGEIEKQYACA